MIMIVFNVYNARGDDLEFRSPGVGRILGRLIPFTSNAMSTFTAELRLHMSHPKYQR
jgi:hypothetical protein